MYVSVLILERKPYMAKLVEFYLHFHAFWKPKHYTPSTFPDFERDKSSNLVSTSLFQKVCTEVY